MATNETKIPSIPPIPSDVDPKLKTYLNAVDEALKVRLGRTGDPKDRAVTVRELIDTGLAENFKENPFDPNAGTPPNTFIPTERVDVTIPPDVTGFSGAGAFQKIILSWDLAQFPNFAFTEIWRHTSNSIGDATRIDTTRAQVYADTVDAGANFYYWVRHVSTSNIVGQFTSGINVTTSKISNSNVSDFITTGALTAAEIETGSLTSASGVFGAISGNDITAGTLNADRIITSTLDVGGKAILGSIGRISGTAGNDGTIVNEAEIFQGNFTNDSPNHIAAANHSDANVSAGDVMGGSPIFSHSFTTFDYSGTRDFIIQVYLDPLGSYGSSSSVGFAYAMRQTTSSGAYTSTSASDYISMRGTSKSGSISGQNPMLTDVVSLSGDTTFFIWAFAVTDDVSNASFRDGQISVMGLNK